jgi:hypothetical protein
VTVFYLLRKKIFFACLLNGLPLYFVPHFVSRVALLDPRPVIERKMAHSETLVLHLAKRKNNFQQSRTKPQILLTVDYISVF